MVQLLRDSSSQINDDRPLYRWNIAAVNLFFRHRNSIFPVVFSVAVFVMRPKVLLNQVTDSMLVACGTVVAVMGEGVRWVTIGHQYIERGGKEGKVYASRLVRGGMYGVMRNPMYVGNILIAVGMTMTAGSPGIYLIILPSFLFIYQALVCTEEAYLRQRFGGEYEAYCAEVPRFIPALRHVGHAVSGTEYDWRRALRQDLSTLVALMFGLTWIPLWRTFFLEGALIAKKTLPGALGVSFCILAFYGYVIRLKKQARLE